ncbi:MAG TPA: ABC transporter ATP-binding protein [Usitatibacter sp.]|nr:ABC transporter ATP-binding protein [Usitatibacter sp.]
MTLEAHGLSIGFGTRVVGTGIDTVLAGGEVTCLLGPNGSGKSTLLRTLLGVQPALGGDIRLDGQRLESWNARDRARRVAYVPQAAATAFDFTVLELVQMGLTPWRGLFAAPGAQARDAALECLDRLGIAPLAARPIQRLSGGERQLAYLARALATRATHLLMDEPTANLDFANQALILDEIARLAAGGACVLFTTHHPDHALRVAHRAMLLRRGTLMGNGPAGDILNSENLSALYGRPVEMAELPSASGRPDRFCIVRESRRFD